MRVRAAAAILLSVAPLARAQALRERADLPLPGAEIVAVHPDGERALLAGRGVVRFVRLTDDAIAPIWTVAAHDWLPALGADASVTHVCIDPRGDGRLAALIAPARSWERTGRVVIADLATGALLRVYEVGYGPDGAAFAPGTPTLIVANEGEPGLARDTVLVDPPGSVSFIDTDTDDAPITLSLLPPESTDTTGLRIHPHNRAAITLDLEPEYVAVHKGRAYVTLQENNAVAVFDWTTPELLELRPLGAILTVIDSNDHDDAPLITEPVLALPMPDQIAAFELRSRAYLVTANEGDDRGAVGSWPLGDTARAGSLRNDHRLDSRTPASHRLKLCAFTGDTNHDGVIDHPAVLGARSLAVWDADTGELVGHTASAFERALAEHPRFWNATGQTDKELEPDERSDDRGPEPEGVAIGEFHGKPIAFVGIERPGAIAIVDLSTPASPALLTLHLGAAQGRFAPEGLTFIHATADRPARLLVAYEGSGHVVLYDIENTDTE